MNDSENILLRSLTRVFEQVGLELPEPVRGNATLCLFPPKAPKFALPARKGFAAWKNGSELYPGITPAHVLRKLALVLGFPLWRRGRGVHIENVKETAQHLYRSLSKDADRADEVAAFAVRGGSAGAGEKLILQFQDERGAPLCYVKVGDAEHRAPFLRNERDVFQTLEHSGATLRAPRVLGYKSFQSLEALEIEALNGARYFPTSGKERVVEMLIDLFEKTAVSNVWKQPEWMSDFSILDDQKTREFVQQQMAVVQSSKFGCPLVHRDMAAWNVFSLNGKLGVLDWEYGRSEHLPFQDLFHFLLHTEIHSGGRPAHQAYERVFSSSRNQRLIADYAAVAGVEDWSLIKALRVAYLWDWFAFERSRAGEGSAQGMEYRELIDWLAKNENRI